MHSVLVISMSLGVSHIYCIVTVLCTAIVYSRGGQTVAHSLFMWPQSFAVNLCGPRHSLTKSTYCVIINMDKVTCLTIGFVRI